MPPIPSFVQRSLGTVTYQSGTRQTMLIDRDGVLLQMNLRLQFTVTNGASAAVGALWNTLARLFRRIEVVLDGQDTVVSIDGQGLAARAHIENGVPAYGMSDTVVLTGSAVTAYDIVLPLAFYLPRGRRPDDTALDLRNIQQAVLAITWGNENDIYATPNSAAISAVTCSVEGLYMVNVDPVKRYLARALDMVSQPFTATNNNMSTLMDRGQDIYYRSFMVAALDDSIASNSLLNNIQLVSGAFTFVNRNGVLLRGDMQRQYSLNSLPTGLYMVDTSMFGEATTAINTGVLTADLYMKFDVTYTAGVNELDIYREAIRPLRI